MPEKLSTLAAPATELPVFHPLDDFYARAGQALPPMQQIDGQSMPEPHKTLLVHENDMTPTLERFYGRVMVLRVMSRRREGDLYFREVALVSEHSERPVEFGAIKINLALFEPVAREQIMAEHLPLGTIMRDYKVPHFSRPSAFLRLASDKLINEILKLNGAQVLYGRRNTLIDPQQRALAEVVEILPSGREEGGSRVSAASL